MNNMGKLKQISVTITSALLIVVLAACGGGNEEGSENGGNVDLTVWLWPGFGLQELASEYEDNNPGVTINIQEADYGDVHQNLITALAAGSGAPDITGIDQGYIDRMHENAQHFHNLYDFGAEEIRDDYLEWKWGQATNPEDDFLIGVPTDVGPMVMAYRMDLFEEAGLPTDPDEVAELINTWEDYLEVGRQLKEQTGVNMFNRIADLYLAIIEQGQEQYFDTDGNYIGEVSEQNILAWNLASSATDISANVERGQTEWSAALAAGDFATVLLPPWMMQNIKNDAPDTAGLWNVTFMPEGSGNFGGSFLALPKQGDHPEEAYDFITWVMAPEQQLRIFENSGPFPSTPVVYDEPSIQELTDDFFTRPDLGALYAESAELIVAGYKGVMHDPVSQLFQDALTNVEDGNTTPEQAWESANSEAERQVSR